MKFREIANKLLKALSNYLNQPPVKLGEDAKATVSIGRHEFFFSLSECRQYLLSQSPIAKLPADLTRRTILRRLAASNYHSSGEGYVLGLEKTTSQIWLTCRFWLAREKPDSFLKSLAIQVGLAEHWGNVTLALLDPPELQLLKASHEFSQ
ncbi:MAG: type III secretion system chaperone [Deltaproteobacteria bacterium]|jgi:hypothetical protein|nr:type III secretion system chaperone [Deltaproteobacteria bacterium]